MRTLRTVSFLSVVAVLMAGSSLEAAWEACSGFGGPSNCCMVGFAFSCDQYCVASGYGSGSLDGSCSAEVAGDTYYGEICWCEGPVMEAATGIAAPLSSTAPAATAVPPAADSDAE